MLAATVLPEQYPAANAGYNSGPGWPGWSVDSPFPEDDLGVCPKIAADVEAAGREELAGAADATPHDPTGSGRRARRWSRAMA